MTEKPDASELAKLLRVRFLVPEPAHYTRHTSAVVALTGALQMLLLKSPSNSSLWDTVVRATLAQHGAKQ